MSSRAGSSKLWPREWMQNLGNAFHSKSGSYFSGPTQLFCQVALTPGTPGQLWLFDIHICLGQQANKAQIYLESWVWNGNLQSKWGPPFWQFWQSLSWRGNLIFSKIRSLWAWSKVLSIVMHILWNSLSENPAGFHHFWTFAIYLIVLTK